jgi:hypothetical protein
MSETEQHDALDQAAQCEPSDEVLTRLAVELVLTVMRSASTDDIRPIDWWPRARAALEVGAAEADSFPHLVSRMGSKLSIEAYREASSRLLKGIGQSIGEGWPRFRELARRDALYIVAMAQAERARIKEATQ